MLRAQLLLVKLSDQSRMPSRRSLTIVLNDDAFRSLIANCLKVVLYGNQDRPSLSDPSSFL